jgi:SOS-response transcriptional repressor LexA
MSLTVQQHRLLTFLVERITATGVCPSVKEMMHALDTRGRGAVGDTVDILEARGYIRRLFRRRARCIEILRLPDDLSRRWLEGVSNAAMVHELCRRGIGAETCPGHVLCGDCGAERRLLPGADLALVGPPPAGDTAPDMTGGEP